ERVGVSGRSANGGTPDRNGPCTTRSQTSRARPKQARATRPRTLLRLHRLHPRAPAPRPDLRPTRRERPRVEPFAIPGARETSVPVARSADLPGAGTMARGRTRLRTAGAVVALSAPRFPLLRSKFVVARFIAGIRLAPGAVARAGV